MMSIQAVWSLLSAYEFSACIFLSKGPPGVPGLKGESGESGPQVPEMNLCSISLVTNQLKIYTFPYFS